MTKTHDKPKKKKKKIVKTLKNNRGPMTTNEIEERIDVTQSTINLYKKELIDEDIVEVRDGKGPNPDVFFFTGIDLNNLPREQIDDSDTHRLEYVIKSLNNANGEVAKRKEVWKDCTVEELVGALIEAEQLIK
jgi:predicted ArsR family transcriptional regulator